MPPFEGAFGGIDERRHDRRLEAVHVRAEVLQCRRAVLHVDRARVPLAPFLRHHADDAGPHVAEFGVEAARLDLDFLDGIEIHLIVGRIVHRIALGDAVDKKQRLGEFGPAQLGAVHVGADGVRGDLRTEHVRKVLIPSLFDLLRIDIALGAGDVSLDHRPLRHDHHFVETHRFLRQFEVDFRGEVGAHLDALDDLGREADERCAERIRAGTHVDDAVVPVGVRHGTGRGSHDGHVDARQRGTGPGLGDLSGQPAGLGERRTGHEHYYDERR